MEHNHSYMNENELKNGFGCVIISKSKPPNFLAVKFAWISSAVMRSQTPFLNSCFLHEHTFILISSYSMVSVSFLCGYYQVIKTPTHLYIVKDRE